MVKWHFAPEECTFASRCYDAKFVNRLINYQLEYFEKVLFFVNFIPPYVLDIIIITFVYQTDVL